LTVTVVASAQDRALTGVRACVGIVCTNGVDVRVPRSAALSTTFEGLDFTDEVRVAFSEYLHSWFARPDCASGRLNETALSTGTAGQSSPIQIVFALPGVFHVCVSTKYGREGSWWPQGEPGSDESSVYVTVIEPTDERDITAVRPARAVAGMFARIALPGVQYSDFTRVAFVAHGAECTHTAVKSETTVNSTGSTVFLVPPAGRYDLCCRIVGTSGFVKQVQDAVQFFAIRSASPGSVTVLEAVEYGIGPQEELVLTAGEPENVRFVGAGWGPAEIEVGFEAGSSENCSDVRYITALKAGADHQSEPVVVELPRVGAWSVCYRTSGEWVLQDSVSVEVIPAATRKSITALDCDQELADGGNVTSDGSNETDADTDTGCFSVRNLRRAHSSHSRRQGTVQTA
jgi:hypothetical protein